MEKLKPLACGACSPQIRSTVRTVPGRPGFLFAPRKSCLANTARKRGDNALKRGDNARNRDDNAHRYTPLPQKDPAWKN